MKFTKGADVNMTGLRGYVRTTFRELTEVFGWPIENWDNVPLAKFAQLIVQECISMADKESERYSNLDQEYCSMAMDNYRELVRKHFGVEE
jgi:hypothetical protein